MLLLKTRETKRYVNDLLNLIELNDLKGVIDNNLINIISSLEKYINNFEITFNSEDSNIISWVEGDNKESLIFISSPISVDNYLKNSIFDNQENIILTGATLTSFGSPEEFCNEIGINNLNNYEIFDS